MLKTLALVALFLSSTVAVAEQRLALVIGNDNYEYLPDLKKAVNDAKTMAEVFKELGFTVTTGTDVSKQSWADISKKFADSFERDSTVVVYVASHGLSVDGVQYIAPVDVSESASKGNVDDMLASSINFDEYMELLSNQQAKQLVVIFDSCRNNPFKKHTRGLQRVAETKPAVAILYSASPGACPFESITGVDTTPNSPFVRILAEELRKSAAPLSKISNKVRAELYATGLQQQSWYHESSSEEIILHPR